MSWLTVERARRVVAGLLVVFWFLVLAGGAVNPGYSHIADHLSDLASFGARVPVIGILAIATFGAADAVAARVVVGRSRAAAVALVVAGGAGLVIAASRIHCSEGAAGCPRSEVDDGTWTDVLHGQAVVVNALAFFVAMIVCAVGRVGAGRASWWRPTVVVLAIVGLVFLSQAIGDGAVGAWQRGWLVTNTVLLLLVTQGGPVASASPVPGRTGTGDGPG